MSLHAVLESLIHNTTFRSEAERHELLDAVRTDSGKEPEETDLAPVSWQTPVPKGPDGQPVVTPTAMTAAQADELIALLKAQQQPKPLTGADVPAGLTTEPAPPVTEPVTPVTEPVTEPEA